VCQNKLYTIQQTETDVAVRRRRRPDCFAADGRKLKRLKRGGGRGGEREAICFIMRKSICR
jgi:hypothetical protein